MQKNKLRIKAKDGVDIPAFAYNLGEAPVKGIVIISAGFGEHSGSYYELIERLTGANYASVIFDQRGHGSLGVQSPEERKKLQGIVPSYQCFLDDIECITTQVKEKSLPLMLYGHSMGGNIVVNYLLKNDQSDFACAVMESPWLGLHKEVDPFTAGLARVLGAISPKIAIINKLNYSDITGEGVRAEEISKDSLYHNRISMRLFSGINGACKYALDNAARLAIPTYLTFAKDERIVSNQAIQRFLEACGPNVTSKEYGACHATHNDVNKEEFYKDVIAFFDAHCES